MVTEAFLDERNKSMAFDTLCEWETFCVNSPVTLELDGGFRISCTM